MKRSNKKMRVTSMLSLDELREKHIRESLKMYKNTTCNDFFPDFQTMLTKKMSDSLRRKKSQVSSERNETKHIVLSEVLDDIGKFN